MARTAVILIACGILFYAGGLLALHYATSPFEGIASADVMFGCVTIGTLLIVGGVMLRHRLHVRQKQLGNG